MAEPLILSVDSYHRRAKVAMQRPESLDREMHSTTDVFKREVEMITHHKQRLQLVSAMQINLDDRPEWDVWVAFQQAGKHDGDYFVEQRLWSEEMWDAAKRTMRALMFFPREIYGVRSKWRTRTRPSEWHAFFPTTNFERAIIASQQAPGAVPLVRAVDPGDRMRNSDSPAEPVE